MILLEDRRSNLFRNIRKTGVYFVLLACFFTPLSTSLLGIFSLLAVLAWFFSGGLSDIPRVLQNHPPAILALLLFILMCLGTIYTSADPLQAFDTLKKYRELLLLPIIISLLSISAGYGEMAENSFITGCIILMLISYGMAVHIIPEERYGHSLVFHITHSFFMAILSFWALHRSIDSHQYRYLWITVYLVAVVNIFYIAPGRTGMLVFITLMLLFLYQRLNILHWLIGMFILVGSMFIIYSTSDNFSERIDEVFIEIQQYQAGHSRTSIGQRFDWWYSSFALIKERPVLGHGTGSFPNAQRRLAENSEITPTDNPHNEFLFLTVQFGLTGLLLFGALTLSQLTGYPHLPENKRWLLQGVVFALLSGSLINSLLFDSQQGHFYLFMSAALMCGQTKDYRYSL